MWKCPNCETINEGGSCIICGEPKPTIRKEEHKAEIKQNVEPKIENKIKSEPEPVPSVEVKRPSGTEHKDFAEERSVKKKSSGVRTLVVVMCIVIAVLAGALFYWINLESKYGKAVDAMADGDYSEARELFGGITFYRDADELLTECDYQEALDLLDSGEAEKARSILREISGYEDSKELLTECDYVSAKNLLEGGNFLEAYDAFSALDDYNDSEDMLDETRELMYYEAIELYRNNNITEARNYFDKTNGIGDTYEYLTLIDAKNGTLSDASEIMSLIDFEDADEIIMENDSYLQEFLVGEWTNSLDDSIEFYKEDPSDSSITCVHSFQRDEDALYYRLENGIYSEGDGDTYTRKFSFEIQGADKIKVYHYGDGRTYTLYRN